MGMTIMCFDLCTIFVKEMAMPHIGKGHKRFAAYSILGWVFPIIMNVAVNQMGLMNHIDASSAVNTAVDMALAKTTMAPPPPPSTTENLASRSVFNIFEVIPNVPRKSESVTKPETSPKIFQETRCFLGSQDARYYLYVPIFILLLSNLLMFAAIIYYLIKKKRATRRAVNSRVSNTSKQVSRT